MSRSVKIHGSKTALHTAAAALAAPSGALAGGATGGWKQGGSGPRGVAIAIDAIGGGVTLQNAVLCVYDPDPRAVPVPMWRQAVLLNNGQDIDITDHTGLLRRAGRNHYGLGRQ